MYNALLVSVKKEPFPDAVSIFSGVLFLGVMFLRIYGDLSDAIPHKDYESIKNYYREELAELKEMNQELSLRLSQMQEKTGEIVRERDSGE